MHAGIQWEDEHILHSCHNGIFYDDDTVSLPEGSLAASRLFSRYLVVSVIARYDNILT